MIIEIRITHTDDRKNAKPVVVHIEESTAETGERWWVNIENREPEPVMDLLQAHHVSFLFDDKHLFVGTEPLSATVINGLVRLPYRFRTER